MIGLDIESDLKMCFHVIHVYNKRWHKCTKILFLKHLMDGGLHHTSGTMVFCGTDVKLENGKTICTVNLFNWNATVICWINFTRRYIYTTLILFEFITNIMAKPCFEWGGRPFQYKDAEIPMEEITLPIVEITRPNDYLIPTMLIMVSPGQKVDNTFLLNIVIHCSFFRISRIWTKLSGQYYISDNVHHCLHIPGK